MQRVSQNCEVFSKFWAGISRQGAERLDVFCRFGLIPLFCEVGEGVLP